MLSTDPNPGNPYRIHTPPNALAQFNLEVPHLNNKRSKLPDLAVALKYDTPAWWNFLFPQQILRRSTTWHRLRIGELKLWATHEYRLCQPATDND